MANVASVFVRLIRRGQRWPACSHGEVIRTLLDVNDGNSYCVPLWLGYRDDGACLDIQYGAPWSPGDGPDQLAKRIASDIDSIWIRWHDSGGDHDFIYAIDATGRTEDRLCRYAFDRVEVILRDGVDPPPLDLPHTVEGRRMLIDASGSYISQNDASAITDPLDVDRFGEHTLRRSAPPQFIDPRAIDAVFSGEIATRVIFSFERYPKHVSLLSRKDGPRGQVHNTLDGWRNCADSDFLIAMGRNPIVPDAIFESDRQWLDNHRRILAEVRTRQMRKS